MKKYLLILVFVFFFLNPAYALFKKKQEPVLLLSSYNPQNEISEGKIKSEDVFKINSKIYFFIYTPSGFKSDYIKYQIVKQDDNAHVAGFSRVRNLTKRVKDKNYYLDYFTISQTGKYFIQIFDITNVHHWIAMGAFRVVDE